MRSIIVVICGVLFLIMLLPTNLPTVVHGAPPEQDATLYFHKQSSKTINTMTTTLWANTTQLWSSAGPTEQRTVVDISPGVWDFYSQPALAGNMTITANQTLTVYLSASSNTGGGTVITGTVTKITQTGTRIQLATANLPTQIHTSVNAFSILILSSSYQLEAGSILDFTVVVSISSATSRTVSLYYDAPSYPSQATLTLESRLGAGLFATYNIAGLQARFFDKNATASNRQITLSASIFDALGLYDIMSVTTNITSPSGIPIASNVSMVRVGTAGNYMGTWDLNMTYFGTDQSGVYTSTLKILDNSGISSTQEVSYTLFTTWRFDVRALTKDPSPIPVSELEVAILANGAPVYFGISNSSGWVTPSLLLPDNNTYVVDSYWQGTLVDQLSSYHPVSSQYYILSLSLYQIDFSKAFTDGSGAPLPKHPASFEVIYPDGSISNPDPSIIYVLPQGTYTISSVIWKGVDVTPAATAFNPKDGTPTFKLLIYDLRVRAVDQNDQPVFQAKVTLFLNGQAVSQALTGSDGTVNFQSLPQGDYVGVVQGSHQSQISRAAITLTSNLATKIQIVLDTPPTYSWITDYSLNWLILVSAVAFAGIAGRILRGRFRKASRHGTRPLPLRINGSTAPNGT